MLLFTNNKIYSAWTSSYTTNNNSTQTTIYKNILITFDYTTTENNKVIDIIKKNIFTKNI